MFIGQRRMAQGEQTVVGGATLRNEIERDFPWVNGIAKRDGLLRTTQTRFLSRAQSHLSTMQTNIRAWYSRV